ncbi:hypothetical protein HID58_070066, partial [Brassica napus]
EGRNVSCWTRVDRRRKRIERKRNLGLCFSFLGLSAAACSSLRRSLLLPRLLIHERMWTRERSTAHVDAKIRQLRGSVMSGMSGTSAASASNLVRTHEAASSTCPVVSTLVEGGATCLGKTAVDQLAFSVEDGLSLVSVFCLCNGHDDPEEGEAFSVVSFVVVVVFSVYDLGNMATLFKLEDRVELFDVLSFTYLLYFSCLLFFSSYYFQTDDDDLLEERQIKLMMMIFFFFKNL